MGGMDFASLKRGYAELSSAQRVEFDAWVMSGYGAVDIGLKLAGLPGEILVQLAETLGNPLALLVSKAHLSKAFCEAARNAQGLLKQADLRWWARTVDDAVVAAVVSKCTQLSSLNLHSCRKITDKAVLAVASGCKLLTTLDLTGCDNITDAAVVAVASECKLLTILNLHHCGKITDKAVVAVASGCKQLTTLGLVCCRSITNAAVLAVASECKLLTTLDLYQCTKITDEAVMAVASGCKELKSLHLGSRGSASGVHWDPCGVYYPLLGGREKICRQITGGRAGARWSLFFRLFCAGYHDSR